MEKFGGIIMMSNGDMFVLFGLMVMIGGVLVSVTIYALMLGAALLVENSKVTKNSSYDGNKAVNNTYSDSSFTTPF